MVKEYKSFFLLLVFLGINYCNAQVLSIAWQRTFGGPGNDIMQDIYPTVDGNYILLGLTDSLGDDVNCNLKGLHDTWAVKMDPSANIIWQHCYGGTVEEGNPYSKIIQTSDGGYLFVTESWSEDSDLIDHHKYSDAWTVKLDALGNIVWSHSFGGGRFDVPRNLLELPGHKYLVMSRSTSGDGDVPQNIDTTLFDAWVFIIDSMGNIISNNIYGGTGDDDLYKPILLPDGNLALFGLTTSHDGDLAGLTVDSTNGWFLKIDTEGNVLSSQVYGNIHNEEFHDAFQTDDGGYIAFGETHDPVIPLEKGMYHGLRDFWAVKLDQGGNLQWQGVYGGSSQENFRRAAPTPGNTGYYLIGTTQSQDGDCNSLPFSSSNFYVLRIAPDGTIVSSLTAGGSETEYGYAVIPNGIVVGGTYSNDGDVQDFNGEADGWVFQVDFPTELAPSIEIEKLRIYPNPSSELLQVHGLSSGYEIEIRNVLGQKMYTAKSESESLQFDVSKWLPGLYNLGVHTHDGRVIPNHLFEVIR